MTRKYGNFNPYENRANASMRRKKEEKKRKEKKNEIIAKNANDTQKQHISQALVSLLNYCLVLPCNLVLFPEMSASQPFRKGSG